MNHEGKATPESQENVIADYANNLKEIEMLSYETAVRKARNALFWTAGLIFLGEMIGMMRDDLGFDPLVLGIAIVESGIFVALGIWTRKKPYTAVVTGLIAFLGIILFSVIVSGMIDGSAGAMKALIGGIIVKVIILATLIKALGDARALQKAKEERF